jgi:hypothetical protein
MTSKSTQNLKTSQNHSHSHNHNNNNNHIKNSKIQKFKKTSQAHTKITKRRGAAWVMWCHIGFDRCYLAHLSKA